MSPVRIVTDSAADLPKDLYAALAITVVPLIVIFGESSYEDTALSSDAFWRLAKGPHPPQTSHPPAGAFGAAYRPLVDEGHDVLCLTITSKHSGSYATAWSAAQDYGERVRVFDSRSLSIGQGWQVRHAAEMALQGADMGEIVHSLSSLRERTHVLIQLDAVEFLRRGGRASGRMPAIDRLLGSLKLKPLLNLVDGELKLLGVARSQTTAVRRMATHLLGLGRLESVGVMHIRSEEGAREMAAALAEGIGLPADQIWLGEAGAVLASHGGQGTIGAIGIRALSPSVQAPEQ